MTIKWIGRILCSFGYHRMVHYGGFHIGGGHIREIAGRECSRCGSELDWLGRRFMTKL
jgi:hypothetical protein